MPTPKEKSTVVEFYPDVPEAEIADLLRGAVDLHCHSGPSVMPRTLNPARSASASWLSPAETR